MKNLSDVLRNVAPTLAGLVGLGIAGPAGPLAAAAVKALSTTLLGKPDAGEAEIEAAVGTATPEQLAALRKLDNDYRVEMARISVDERKVDAQVLGTVNETMRAEAASEHWPSYSWRPFIGFMFGLYIASLWLLPLFSKTPAEMSTDMVLAVGGILGVASWFRGKMQADPNIATTNKG